MEDYCRSGKNKLRKSNMVDDLQISESKKNFLEKNFEPLKWSISFYYLFFALWATFNLLRILLPKINNLVYTIPVIIFIITSTVGAIRLLKRKPNAYNFLIIAQVLQVIILELNGFVYFLLIGQWVILRIGGQQFWGIDFGLLNAKYSFTFLSSKEGFLFGINIIPLILIFILLKMEEIENKYSQDVNHR